MPSPRIHRRTLCSLALSLALDAVPAQAADTILDKQKALDAQTWWDNRDGDWYKANIPFFDCPDPELVTTWYYRWELVTKHLTYGSPNSGYSFTEFIDRPFWSGAYGAISCPVGHQLYEVRWLRDPQYARDYARYWFRTPGAQPRNYGCWLADGIWAANTVHPDPAFITNLLPDLVKNYQGWEARQFVPEVGLFWPAAVVFWSRHCGAIEALPSITRLAERLAREGSRLLLVVDEAPSAELTRYLAARQWTLPAYYDVRGEMRNAFSSFALTASASSLPDTWSAQPNAKFWTLKPHLQSQ